MVIYYKAMQYGTTFDEQKLKAVYNSGIFDETNYDIDQIVYEVLSGIKKSFQLLEDGKERKTKEAYQFLKMIYRVLPSDNKKLRRLTLDKNIPKLTALIQQNEASPNLGTGIGSEVGAQRRQKLKEFYLKELLLTKCIIDFKIHYHLNVSPTAANKESGELMCELLPFAIELHSALSPSVYRVFTKWAREMLPNALSYGLDLMSVA